MSFRLVEFGKRQHQESVWHSRPGPGSSCVYYSKESKILESGTQNRVEIDWVRKLKFHSFLVFGSCSDSVQVFNKGSNETTTLKPEIIPKI